MLWVCYHQKGIKYENVHWEKCFRPLSVPSTWFPVLPWLLGVNTIKFYCFLFPYIFMKYEHIHLYILIDVFLPIKSTIFYTLILTLSFPVNNMYTLEIWDQHIEMFLLFHSCRPTTMKALIALKTHWIPFNLWKSYYPSDTDVS